ncbi:tetratricopeptide repeat protein [Streptomyces paradoxus]|uniref:tetratricopeptide repeat protein n=2 Tax=Streptomyces paradoxus TaxID=66375 RepID=UPI0031DA815A
MSENTFRHHAALQAGPGGIMNNNFNTFYGSPRVPVSWPHQVGVLPRQADWFQSRPAVGALEQAMAGGGTAVLCQVLAGTGGVGKTQLAAHYARALLRDGHVDLLVWATAASREAITDVYARAAVEVLGANPAEPEQAVEAFLAWLEPKPGRQQPCRWLVVLDDLADPVDLRGLWPPTSPHGRTLVTTRRRDASLSGSGRHLINVGLFTVTESVAYLTAALAAHSRQEPADQLTALAGDLGHLPLALSQAAAYILDAGLDCATYRQRLTDRARTLIEVLPEPSGLPDDQATSVAAAWALSIDRADKLRPVGLARPMLHLAALLDPNGIPTSVLAGEPALTHLAEHRTRTAMQDQRPVGAGQVTVEDAVDALRALHRLSLVDHEPGNSHHAVRVHQLTQRATRDTLCAQEREDVASTAASALVAAWPDIERDAALAQALRANATTLARRAEQALYRSGAHQLLFRLGKSLGESGQSGAAATHFQRMENTSHRQLGPEHPDTLTVRHELASWRGEAGDPADAVAGLELVLAERTRVLGRDHPDTLTTRHALASWQGEAGDPADAIAGLELVLADRTRVLGGDHSETLTTRHSLLYWREQAGDPARDVVVAYEQLLADRIRVLGRDHPETLVTRHNLAYSMWEAGDRAAAVTDLEHLLADEVRILGVDHPGNFITRANLAGWRGQADDVAGAVADLERLLADQVRVLGADHRDTLATRHTIASWQGQADAQAGDVVAAYERLLADQVRVLGEDHRDTLGTRRALADWRGEAGGAAGAIADLERLLADQVRVLGEDHRDTLGTRRALADWRGEAGGAAGAVADLERLLADQVRVLGEDHRDTLGTRRALADWRGQAGDAAGAVADLERLLADQVRVLGEDHRDTLGTRRALADWRGQAGDAAGAAASFQRLLECQVRLLGEENPDTLSSCQYLAHWQGQAGDAAGAAASFQQLLAWQTQLLGDDHPSTLTTRHQLAHWRGQAGDAAGAAASFQQLLARYPDAPDSLSMLQELAYWRLKAGDAEGSEAVYEELFKEMSMGSVHSGGVNVPLLQGWEDRSQAIVVQTQQTDGFRPNIVVVREDSKARTMDEFVAQSLEALKSTFQQLEVGHSEPTALGRHSGHLIDFTFIAQGQQYRQAQFYTAFAAYIFTFTASNISHRFPAFWPVAKRIIEETCIEGA